MTPDLPTRVREAFEKVRGASWQRHEDGTDEALAAVIASAITPVRGGASFALLWSASPRLSGRGRHEAR